jgi:hypothetical protein
MGELEVEAFLPTWQPTAASQSELATGFELPIV